MTANTPHPRRHDDSPANRREFLFSSAATLAAATLRPRSAEPEQPALIAITLDLEMSRHYPKRGMTEWDYQKGNLDAATKQYAAQAARIVADLGGVIHFFCVGRVLEQPDVQWLRQIHSAGHPVGNHTYDHVNVLATEPTGTQFRFQRSPWLTRGRTAREIINENILLTRKALQNRVGIEERGFRTPGGFANGLSDRPDVRQLLRQLGYDWVSARYPRHDTGRARQKPTAAVLDDIVRAQQHAQPFTYPDGLVEVPMSPISDVNAFRSNFWQREWYLEAVRRAVTWAIETGNTFDWLAHPSCLVVEDPKFDAIRLICQLVQDAGDRARLTDLDTIAQRAAPSAH